MNILLVEPNYKNKYPPMGLMKISTYHKRRGDNVYFYKGKMKVDDFNSLNIDRVYISTLFTFYYKITVETIKYYRKLNDYVYIGGIMSTLMHNKLNLELDGQCKIIDGQLFDSSMIGFDDKVNIDSLPLDYHILDEIEYIYPSGDNYFAYTSRGCTNKCKFCAVPILEPKLMFTNNIKTQVEEIENHYGRKRNLLLMDNNILSFSNEQLEQLVDDICELGFDKKTKFIPNLPLDDYIEKLERLRNKQDIFQITLNRCIEYLNEKKKTKKSKNYSNTYEQIIDIINKSDDKYDKILEYRDILREILSAYFRPLGQVRHVDFNQGIDARILSHSEDKMRILSRIPISPFRLAFDKLEYADYYEKALRLAYQYDVKEFSNYLLYNFDDKPEELWERLKINIDLAKELDVKIFSFPMKFAPITDTDRKYIGVHWNKKYLSNIHAILNVSKGIVAGGESFFYRAYGKNIDEYFEILTMPRDFVTYRKYFEKVGLTHQWKNKYNMLNDDEKNELVLLLSDNKTICNNDKINDILSFYNIHYNDYIKIYPDE